MNRWKKYLSVGVMSLCIASTSLSVGAKPVEQVGMQRDKFAVKIVEDLGYTGIAKAYDDATSFSDVKENKGAVYMVSQMGLMNGVGKGMFNPKGELTSAQVAAVEQKIDDRLNQEIGWQHGFYAIASSSQMDKIKNLDGVSFGWSQVEYRADEQAFVLNTTSTGGNDFRIPDGFEVPMDVAKANGVETYLMVYFEDRDGLAQKLFSDKNATTKLVQDLVDLCNGVSKNGETRKFDGLTIDFENFRSSELQKGYNQFLMQLDEALTKEGKKLNVAVQPNKYFKGYDYKAIGEVADHVILMAHDYAPKKLSAFDMGIGSVHTPQTPIAQVYKDLESIMNQATGIADKEKIALQISFASTQWQTKEGKVIHEYPYTPGYEQVNQRLAQPGTKAYYDVLSQNPYAVYTQDGITNTIWYEDEKSVAAKESLVKLFGLGGVSYWRLGTIPEFVVIQ